MKIAIVHDYLNQYGGAERVVETILEIWPDAPIFTSIYEPKNLPEKLKEVDIRTSFIQKLPFIRFFTKHYTFIYPLVFEFLDLSEYDVVISSSANFAKGVVTKPKTLHISYCHTVPRFLYHYPTEINRRSITIYKPILAFLDNYFRIWDHLASKRVDFFIANSKNTALRIKKFYRQNSEVIYPPVEVEKFSRFVPGNKVKEYFLAVSRLSFYKRIDLAIKACGNLKLPLKIVGEGRDRKRLEKIAKGYKEKVEISFLGKVSDDVLAEYYQGCQAVIFPGEEDFGIVPVEAMAAGKPVIAFGKGGVTESVIPGRTGEFFYEEKVESLMKVLEGFDPRKYKSEDCINQAKKFSKDRFKKEFREFVEKKWSEWNGR